MTEGVAIGTKTVQGVVVRDDPAREPYFQIVHLHHEVPDHGRHEPGVAARTDAPRDEQRAAEPGSRRDVRRRLSRGALGAAAGTGAAVLGRGAPHRPV